MSYHFKADAYTYTTRQSDTEDRWDNGDDATDWTIFTDKLYSGEPYKEVGTFYDVNRDDLVEGQEYWAVVAIWDTGNSFGRSERYYAQITYIADTLDQIRDYVRYPSNYHSGMLPWEGYFESLYSLDYYKTTYVGEE